MMNPYLFLADKGRSSGQYPPESRIFVGGLRCAQSSPHTLEVGRKKDLIHLVVKRAIECVVNECCRYFTVRLLVCIRIYYESDADPFHPFSEKVTEREVSDVFSKFGRVSSRKCKPL